jgi:hypothetical protein
MARYGKDTARVYLQGKESPINKLMEEVSLAAFLYSQVATARLTFAELKQCSLDNDDALQYYLDELIKKQWVLSYIDSDMQKYYFNFRKLDENSQQ